MSSSSLSDCSFVGAKRQMEKWGLYCCGVRSALHWEMASTGFQGQTQGGGGSGSFLEQLKNKVGGERNL